MASRTGAALSTLSLDELCANYRAVGGNLTQRELTAALVVANAARPLGQRYPCAGVLTVE
ncbi:MAG: hypothetical protein QOC83_7293 [Pseudonocardiales bacterium]|nr:hypothetical protein [Pseudonocardiales bacterium]